MTVNRTGRTRHVTAAAGGAFRRTTHSGVYLPLDGGEPRQGWDPAALVPERGGLTWNDARDGEQAQSGDVAPGAIDGSTHISPGTLPASTFDPTPPAVPTGLTLASDVVTNSDGSSYVRLLISLTQPTDGDLFGSYVEVTSHNDGAPSPSPIWDRPEVVFIPLDQTQGRLENVQGNTQYWARARAVDVQDNLSAFTTVISHTTVRDTVAPPTPETPEVVAGFRGVALAWSGGDALDRAFYGVRYAQGASPPVDDVSWTYETALVSVIWIPNLTPGVTYWFQVRSVDLSSNFSAWTDAVSAVPSQVGQSDIAADSIISAMIRAGELDADKIGAGTLTLKPGGANAVAIQVLTIDDELVIDLRNDGSMKFVDPNNPSHYLYIDAGQLKFTTDNGVTFPTAITPEGINASAITFGEAPGGHNLILNSSFELSAITDAPSTATFTDNSATPGWKAANRLASPTNITEGAADLQQTSLAY